jgi:hypothetical protein
MNVKEPPETRLPTKVGEVVRLVPRLRIVPPLRSDFMAAMPSIRHLDVPSTMAMNLPPEKSV